MKYALEYDLTDPNTLTIHFDKELIGNSTSPIENMKAETTYEPVAQGEINVVVDDYKDDNNDAEMIFYGKVNNSIISPCLKMMGDTIYSLNGVRNVEICDYEIILEKSFFFEWKRMVNSVVATVLMFVEPEGKATETPFTHTCGKNNKKGRKNKKNYKKTKTAEISWSFQD